MRRSSSTWEPAGGFYLPWNFMNLPYSGMRRRHGRTRYHYYCKEYLSCFHHLLFNHFDNVINKRGPGLPLHVTLMRG